MTDLRLGDLVMLDDSPIVLRESVRCVIVALYLRAIGRVGMTTAHRFLMLTVDGEPAQDDHRVLDLVNEMIRVTLLSPMKDAA